LIDAAQRKLMDGGDDFVLEIADAHSASKAFAAFLEQMARLGAPIFKRVGDDTDRRLAEALIIGNLSPKSLYSCMEPPALAAPFRGGGGAARTRR
jgi:hypothetical protein